MLKAAARDITVWNMFQILWNTSESNTKQSTNLEYTDIAWESGLSARRSGLQKPGLPHKPSLLAREVFDHESSD